MPTDNFTTPGANTWTCPVGVSSVVYTLRGGGGSGGISVSGGGCGGGGGGGATVTGTLAVVESTVYNLYVGAGGISDDTLDGEASWFVTSGTVLAAGGSGGQNGLSSDGFGGNGGQDAASLGTSKYSGGNGGDGNSGAGTGGGGGSSAGTSGNGNNASGATGGAAPSGGVAGVNGDFDGGANGNAGGGGAAGGGDVDNIGGNGGAGFVTLTYTAGSAYTLDAQPGTFAVTGADAQFPVARAPLDAAPGSFVVTGVDATFDLVVTTVSDGGIAGRFIFSKDFYFGI